MCGLPRGLGAAGDPATGAGRESGTRGQRRGPAGRFRSRGICDEATAHVLEQQTRVLPAGRGPPTPHGVAGVRAGRGRCGLRGATCARTPRGGGAPHHFAANRPPSSRLCALTRARAAWETPPRARAAPRTTPRGAGGAGPGGPSLRPPCRRRRVCAQRRAAGPGSPAPRERGRGREGAGAGSRSGGGRGRAGDEGRRGRGRGRGRRGGATPHGGSTA